MSVISLRLPDKLLYEVDDMARELHLQRTTYIRKAIEHMNAEILHEINKRQMVQASMRVRENSMKVNQDFSDIENDPEI